MYIIIITIIVKDKENKNEQGNSAGPFYKSILNDDLGVDDDDNSYFCCGESLNLTYETVTIITTTKF